MTLEECKRLAEQGLPQELKEDDLYWEVRPDVVGGLTRFRYFEHSDLILYPYYKIPNLEELMEFADVVGAEKYGERFNGTALASSADIDKGGLGKYSAWYWAEHVSVLSTKDNDFPCADDDVRIQAIYKLIEKVKDE